MVQRTTGHLHEGDVIMYDNEEYQVSGVDWTDAGEAQVFLCGGPNDCVDWVLPLRSCDTVDVVRLAKETD